MVNDLINRQAAIKLLEDWADGYSYLEVPVDSIAHKLNELPTAEPKKGKWIEKNIHSNWSDWTLYFCSECGKQFKDLEERNFCPNCGARMEEKNNESNNI